MRSKVKMIVLGGERKGGGGLLKGGGMAVQRAAAEKSWVSVFSGDCRRGKPHVLFIGGKAEDLDPVNLFFGI